MAFNNELLAAEVHREFDLAQGLGLEEGKLKGLVEHDLIAGFSIERGPEARAEYFRDYARRNRNRLREYQKAYQKAYKATPEYKARRRELRRLSKLH